MKHIAPAVCLTCLLLVVATCALGQGFYQSTHRCAVCGQPVFGDYLEIDGKYYHREHFLCEYCKKPIRDSYITVEHKHYHTTCYSQRVVLVCYVCNRPIYGNDGRQDDWGNTYHAQHLAEYQRCDFCGRLIFGAYAAGRRHLPDGRDLCGLCAPTAVTTVTAAESLMTRTVRYLAADGIRVQTRGITILLLNQDKMQKLDDAGNLHVHGFTDYASRSDSHGREENKGGNLYLLYGMPEVQMEQTLAHELMHVWQGSHNPLQDDRALCEGSANYAAYLVMKRVGTRESEFIITSMMKDVHPLYGEGFRRVKRYGDKHGVNQVIQVIGSDHPVLTDD